MNLNNAPQPYQKRQQNKPMTVIYADSIIYEIEHITEYNEDNVYGIAEWRKHLNGIRKYISDWSIAFDYANQFTRINDKVTLIEDFGYNLYYSLIEDTNHQIVVYVSQVNLAYEDYGLEYPLYENRRKYNKSNIISQSRLMNIIRASVRQALREVLNEKTLSEHLSFGRRRPNRVRNL